MHLIQLGNVDDGQRVFLALHHFGLQRRIHLTEIDASWCCTKGLEHGRPQRTDRHADFEAFQIFRRDDRFGRGGDVSETVVENAVKAVQVDLGNGRANIRAQIAVHRSPNSVVVLEGKSQAVDACQRHEGLQNQPRQRKDINRTAAYLRQHVGVATELVVRKYLNVNLAACLCANCISSFLDADVGRVRNRDVVGPFQSDVAALGEGGCAQHGGCGCGCHESAAADGLL